MECKECGKQMKRIYCRKTKYVGINPSFMPIGYICPYCEGVIIDTDHIPLNLKGRVKNYKFYLKS